MKYNKCTIAPRMLEEVPDELQRYVQSQAALALHDNLHIIVIIEVIEPCEILLINVNCAVHVLTDEYYGFKNDDFAAIIFLPPTLFLLPPKCWWKKIVWWLTTY